MVNQSKNDYNTGRFFIKVVCINNSKNSLQTIILLTVYVSADTTVFLQNANNRWETVVENWRWYYSWQEQSCRLVFQLLMILAPLTSETCQKCELIDIFLHLCPWFCPFFLIPIASLINLSCVYSPGLVNDRDFFVISLTCWLLSTTWSAIADWKCSLSRSFFLGALNLYTLLLTFSTSDLCSSRQVLNLSTCLIHVDKLQFISGAW